MQGGAARAGVGLCAALAVLSILLACSAAAAAAGRRLTVPRVTIYPGDFISGDLLTTRKIKRRRRAGRKPRAGGGIFASREFLIGKVARRTLLRGRPIPRNAVRAPDVVKRGKSVLVSYRSGRLLITAYATALQSGRAGDIVSLRNVDSGSIISGRVLQDGSIQLRGAR